MKDLKTISRGAFTRGKAAGKAAANLGGAGAGTILGLGVGICATMVCGVAGGLMGVGEQIVKPLGPMMKSLTDGINDAIEEASQEETTINGECREVTS